MNNLVSIVLSTYNGEKKRIPDVASRGNVRKEINLFKCGDI